jgi:PAS domain S-box-containing protein
MDGTRSMDRVAIVLVDLGGTIRFWSAGAEKLVGFSSQDALGQTLDLIVPSAHRADHWNGFRRAMEVGSAAMEGQSFELPVRCKSGEQMVFPATFALVRDGAKNTIGAMAILSPPST